MATKGFPNTPAKMPLPGGSKPKVAKIPGMAGMSAGTPKNVSKNPFATGAKNKAGPGAPQGPGFGVKAPAFKAGGAVKPSAMQPSQMKSASSGPKPDPFTTPTQGRAFKKGGVASC